MLRWAAVGVVILTVVSACGAVDSATKPALTWLDGQPEGPLEEDEWVKAVRAAEFSRAWAANTADFSTLELTQTWDTFLVMSFVSEAQGHLLHGVPRVYPGPRSLAPVAVDVAEDGRSAVVVACVDAPQTQPQEDDDNRWPNVKSYEVELSDDGHRRVVGGLRPDEPILLIDGTELTPEHCDGVTIPRAVFSPAPSLEVLAKKGREDVILPSPTPSGRP